MPPLPPQMSQAGFAPAMGSRGTENQDRELLDRCVGTLEFECEKFELTSQVKRAALSIPLNIAEGSGRKTQKDFCHFIRMSIGSVLEVVTCLKIALREKFIEEKEYRELEILLEKVYFKLVALEKSLID